MVVVGLVSGWKVVVVERGLMSYVWAGMVVVVGVSGWEVAHSVSRRPAGHSEESNYSLMDPTATARRPGRHQCLSPPELNTQTKSTATRPPTSNPSLMVQKLSGRRISRIKIYRLGGWQEGKQR